MSEPIPQIAHPVPRIVIEKVAIGVDPNPTSAPSSSASKPKPRNNIPVALRKAPLTALKPRDTNIMPKKVGVAGPTRKSSLNLLNIQLLLLLSLPSLLSCDKLSIISFLR
ncbi:hypothetical protein V6N12_045334 [Hibiscus sabdariffa]|uniref:Uncharacterized protein n=1 Tax=Hibiscus sabdariffa TaxID=183260 RepID=A0ABR2G2F9_9ROSI